MIPLLSCVQFVPSLILSKPHFPIILYIMPSNFSSMSIVIYAVLFLLVMAATNISVTGYDNMTDVGLVWDKRD